MLVIFIDFFFNDTATTEIYTLSLHDALPISERPRIAAREAGRRPARAGRGRLRGRAAPRRVVPVAAARDPGAADQPLRSEEHTSELQSRQYLVCRLLLEKKKI